MAKNVIKIKDLRLNDGNPRFIKGERFEKLKQSIDEFPKMLELRPIVVDDDNMVLGGNMRLRALIDLGYKEVPSEWVKNARELTEKEKERFIIADNVGFGSWDYDILANEWDKEELEDWGLEVPEWGEEVPESDEDEFDQPDELKTDIVLGDFIEIGPHRLLCGDSTQTDNWAKIFKDDLCDLVVTDPPYNVDYTGKTKSALKIQNDKKKDGDFKQFLYDAFTALNSYTKKGGTWYVWHADSEGHNFRSAFVESGLLLKQCLIWNKNSMVMGRQDYHWKHEPCLYGWKEGASHKWYSDRKQTTVLEFDRPQRNGDHPTMKPISLLQYQIGNSSKKGDLVADGFLGSGSTMVAAHQLSRKCYGIELDPKYCQVIIDRMIKLDPDIHVEVNGEQYKKE